MSHDRIWIITSQIANGLSDKFAHYRRSNYQFCVSIKYTVPNGGVLCIPYHTTWWNVNYYLGWANGANVQNPSRRLLLHTNDEISILNLLHFWEALNAPRTSLSQIYRGVRIKRSDVAADRQVRHMLESHDRIFCCFYSAIEEQIGVEVTRVAYGAQFPFTGTSIVLCCIHWCIVCKFDGSFEWRYLHTRAGVSVGFFRIHPTHESCSIATMTQLRQQLTIINAVCIKLAWYASAQINVHGLASTEWQWHSSVSSIILQHNLSGRVMQSREFISPNWGQNIWHLI